MECMLRINSNLDPIKPSTLYILTISAKHVRVCLNFTKIIDYHIFFVIVCTSTLFIEVDNVRFGNFSGNTIKHKLC